MSPLLLCCTTGAHLSSSLSIHTTGDWSTDICPMSNSHMFMAIRPESSWTLAGPKLQMAKKKRAAIKRHLKSFDKLKGWGKEGAPAETHTGSISNLMWPTPSDLPSSAKCTPPPPTNSNNNDTARASFIPGFCGMTRNCTDGNFDGRLWRTSEMIPTRDTRSAPRSELTSARTV